MSTSFSYKIDNLDRETADGYVYTVHYTIHAEDGTYTAGSYGSLGFERAYDVEPVEAKDAVLDADGKVVTPAVEAVEGVLATLIPFADLTESTIVGWVKDKLGADRVTEIELQLQGHLDEQKAPTKATGLPWKGLIKSPDRTDPDEELD